MQTSQPKDEFPVQGTEIPTHSADAPEPGYIMHVWELPVRITHWVNVISIAILTITGIYIAGPFIGTSGPASNQHLMETMRFIHFVTAFVFTASVLFRIYWAFVGNKYARWDHFVPVRSARRRGIRRMMQFYLFLRRNPPAVVGHNPLAGAAYTVLYVLFVLQIITGFALYSIPFYGGFWPAAFAWIITVFGVQPVRFAHDMIMWLFLAFTVHHLYTAVLIDNEERSGIMSSIFTGAKSITRSHMAAALAEDTPDPKRRRWQRARQRDA